ncbi:MAG: arylsulfatase [Anaerorhabdus sp.]
MKRVNIVLIVCDQFRGDALSILGHPDVKTPYLNTLANDGHLFEKAYSACPTCIPARAILHTGQNQRHTKRVGYEEGVEWDYPEMMAEVFKQRGYQTQCVGKMHAHPPRVSCGFENIKLHDGFLHHYRKDDTPFWQHQLVNDDYVSFLKDKEGMNADITNGGVECNSWVANPWIYQEKNHPTNWCVDESINFLKTRDRTRPFFLMTSFVRPHAPFDPPKQYMDMYLNKDLTMPSVGSWVDLSRNQENGYNTNSLDGCNDQELIRQAMAGYYGCITHVDHQIGRLITALELENSYDNSIILFTSDHGELLFDNNTFRKTLPYEGSIRIPCIVHVGKDVADSEKKRYSDLFELRDVMPTLLDFAGLEIPSTVDGLSFKDLILNKGVIEREYIHGEHSGSKYTANQYIVTKKYKYIWYTQRDCEQFFDLEKDPKELVNLIDDQSYQNQIKKLRSNLIDELKDREEGYSDGVSLIKGCNPVNVLKRNYQ